MKFRSVLARTLLIPALILASAYVASPVSAKSDDPKDAVRTYVTAEGSHDWAGLAAVASPKQAKMVKAFADRKDETRGAFRVKSAKLRDIKELPPSFAPQHRDGQPQDMHVYYVAVDYLVDSNDQYYHSGTNYRLVTVARYDKQWRVVDFEVAPTAALAKSEYRFGTPQETMVAQQQMLAASTPTPPTTINVLLLDGANCYALYGEGPECYEVYPVAFLSYQKDTLPREWGENTASEALKAGAMAVKMFAWFHHSVDPKYPAYGADLSDDPATSQVYEYGSNSEPYNTAVTAVARVAMFAQNNSFFEPQYRDAYLGNTTVVGPKSGGIMYQYGSQILANQGNTYQSILRYYYLNSTDPYGLNITNLLFPTY